MWKQLKTPNLDPVVYNGGVALNDWYGWCLATVETAFGTARSYPTAWAAWQATTKKHEDRNWPIGVYFPLWFSGWGGAGHVAFAFINNSGQMNIWTSPYTHIPYFYTGYHDVDVLAKGYLVTYVGWSEDLAGSSLIEFVPDVAPHPYTVQSINPKKVVAIKPATKWNLDDTTWAQFGTNTKGTIEKGTVITVNAIAHHTLGGQYYMEDPAKAEGYNVVDMADYVEPPVVTPPIVTPPVVTPPEVKPPVVDPPVVTPPIVKPPTTTPPSQSLWEVILSLLTKVKDWLSGWKKG